MNIDVIELLNDEALTEQEKYRTFREKVRAYCTKENRVLQIFVILKGIELELETCLDGTVQVNVEKSTVERLLRICRLELEIIRLRIRHPELTDESQSDRCFVGKWTDNKADLIELIYAISAANSVGKGKTSIKAIKEGFEQIFGIDLGNIHDRIEDIASRKENKVRYLEKLVESLKKFLDNLDD